MVTLVSQEPPELGPRASQALVARLVTQVIAALQALLDTLALLDIQVGLVSPALKEPQASPVLRELESAVTQVSLEPLGLLAIRARLGPQVTVVSPALKEPQASPVLRELESAVTQDTLVGLGIAASVA